MRICSVHIVMAVSVGLLLGLAADVRAEATVTVVPSFPDGDVTSVFDVGRKLVTSGPKKGFSGNGR